MKGKVLYIGIDPGVNTGYALWNVALGFTRVASLPIHFVAKDIERLVDQFGVENVHIRFEDARQRVWFGSSGREKLQGAGSVKRDCKIWEDYLTSLGASFEMVPPRSNITKLTADQFKRLTKYEGSTNEHSRDAAMLVFKYK